MKVVWRLKQATVRQVHDALRQHRDVAYTTIMTLMRVLETKGYLEKALVGRAHVSTPLSSREQVVGSMVRDFLDRVCDGAPQALLLHLAKDNRLTIGQRRAVKKLIEEVDE